MFHERVKVYQNWQHAQIVLNKKRETKAKFEIMGRSDKINQAKDEVIEVSWCIIYALSISRIFDPIDLRIITQNNMLF